MKSFLKSALLLSVLASPALAGVTLDQVPPSGRVAYAKAADGTYIPILVGNDGSLTISVGIGQRTIIPLDVSTVTTGGTAVTALSAGHRTAGGFLMNPIGATINLCINEQGAASGSTSAGALTCILPGQSYNLTPAAGAVSVVSSDSSHPFSGQGLN